eukprot:scaffold7029_cov375-Pinguiococcus_pyrenoidosus.AAC.24
MGSSVSKAADNAHLQQIPRAKYLIVAINGVQPMTNAESDEPPPRRSAYAPPDVRPVPKEVEIVCKIVWIDERRLWSARAVAVLGEAIVRRREPRHRQARLQGHAGGGRQIVRRDPLLALLQPRACFLELLENADRLQDTIVGRVIRVQRDQPLRVRAGIESGQLFQLSRDGTGQRVQRVGPRAAQDAPGPAAAAKVAHRKTCAKHLVKLLEDLADAGEVRLQEVDDVNHFPSDAAKLANDAGRFSLLVVLDIAGARDPPLHGLSLRDQTPHLRSETPLLLQGEADQHREIPILEHPA